MQFCQFPLHLFLHRIDFLPLRVPFIAAPRSLSNVRIHLLLHPVVESFKTPTFPPKTTDYASNYNLRRTDFHLSNDCTFRPIYYELHRSTQTTTTTTRRSIHRTDTISKEHLAPRCACQATFQVLDPPEMDEAGGHGSVHSLSFVS